MNELIPAVCTLEAATQSDAQCGVCVCVRGHLIGYVPAHVVKAVALGPGRLISISASSLPDQLGFAATTQSATIKWKVRAIPSSSTSYPPDAGLELP